MRIVHYRQCPTVDMGNDLIPKGEKSISMGIFIFMNLERGNFKGIIPLSEDFIIGDAFEIHLDLEHQHVEM